MAVETMKLPGQPGYDPDIEMGQALVAQKRRDQLIMTVKIGIVWVFLIVFLAIVLLQSNLILPTCLLTTSLFFKGCASPFHYH